MSTITERDAINKEIIPRLKRLDWLENDFKYEVSLTGGAGGHSLLPPRQTVGCYRGEKTLNIQHPHSR